MSARSIVDRGAGLRIFALVGLALASPLVAAADFLYRVERGDTLTGIGQRKLVDPSLWRKVARHNRLTNPNLIVPGQVLRIPLPWLKRTATSAEIIDVRGRVAVSANATSVPAQPGTRIQSGAEVTTGADGFVTLRLADGSSVRIKSGTQMRVDTLTRVPDTEQHQSVLRLFYGRLEVIASKLRGPATRFSIETPVGSTSVRGTEFRVSGDNEGRLQQTEVLEGRTTVAAHKTATGETVVEAGFGTTVDAGGNVARPVALLRALPLLQLPALHERPLVRFRLDPVEGAASYRAQIGLASGFATPLAEVVSTSPELRFQGLPDGDYVLRARAVDARGIEGQDAERSFRLKARPEPPILSMPPAGTKVRGASVEFSWSENLEAARYRFQLARDSGFTSLEREVSDAVGTAHNEAGPLAPGTYHWRVASVRADGDRGPFGDAQTFTLLPPPPQPDPPQIGDNDITFSWAGEPGQRFEFELARDERFSIELGRHALADPGVVLPRPAPGVWHIRYRAIDSDGYVGPYTSPQRFTVPPCVVSSSGRCVGVGSGGVLRSLH